MLLHLGFEEEQREKPSFMLLRPKQKTYELHFSDLVHIHIVFQKVALPSTTSLHYLQNLLHYADMHPCLVYIVKSMLQFDGLIRAERI